MKVVPLFSCAYRLGLLACPIKLNDTEPFQSLLAGFGIDNGGLSPLLGTPAWCHSIV